MAAYNKFNVFVEHVMNADHDLFSGTDLTKVMLVDSPAPVATNSLKADLTEITAENGYTAGGDDTTNTGVRATATFTMAGTKVVFTAGGGTIGPFRYVIHYNDTPTTPLDPLINWWDRGSSLTLQDGESFSVKFNSSETQGDIFTFA